MSFNIIHLFVCIRDNNHTVIFYIFSAKKKESIEMVKIVTNKCRILYPFILQHLPIALQESAQGLDT